MTRAPLQRFTRCPSLAVAAAALWLAGSAHAQPPPPPPAAPGAPAPISAEAPIVGGNAASAKQRALDDAFRQAVEQSFALLMAEAGVSPSQPPPPGLMQLRSTFFSRPKRYILSYTILEQSEQSGRYRLQIAAEVDEGTLRREIDRARGAPVTATAPLPPAGAPLVIVAGTPPEGVIAVTRALGGAGVRTESPPLGAVDEAKAREIAGRSNASAALLLSGNVTDEGPVRGTTKSSASCRLAARVLPVGSAPALDRTAEARAFSDGASAASAECLARAAGDLTRQTATSLAPAVVVPKDMRLVTLDLDIIEPAALPLVMQALKKVGSVSASEVRRVTVGHVEIRATSRLAAPALVAAIARELTGTATVSPGQTVADRVPLQVRLAAPAPPAPPSP